MLLVTLLGLGKTKKTKKKTIFVPVSEQVEFVTEPFRVCGICKGNNVKVLRLMKGGIQASGRLTAAVSSNYFGCGLLFFAIDHFTSDLL